MKHKFLIFTAFALPFYIFSCKSTTIENQKDHTDQIEKEYTPILSRNLRGKGQLTAPQLAYFFTHTNPNSDIIHMINFAFYYVQEAEEEGINSDVAFAQMCLETGFLRFGNLVKPEFHNYCGLGAMDKEHPGEIFETERMGVRAHIQHLHAYATHEEEKLKNELIDPRYNWVHKTKYVETIEGLSGTWATDPNYGTKIDGILRSMEEMMGLK